MSAFLIHGTRTSNSEEELDNLILGADLVKVPFPEVERLIATGELTVCEEFIEIKKFNSIFQYANYDSSINATELYYAKTDFKRTMTVYKHK